MSKSVKIFGKYFNKKIHYLKIRSVGKSKTSILTYVINILKSKLATYGYNQYKQLIILFIYK